MIKIGTSPEYAADIIKSVLQIDANAQISACGKRGKSFEHQAIDHIALTVAMASRGLSRAKLAEMAGMSRTTINAIADGKICSADSAAKLVKVLGEDILLKAK